MIIQLRGGEKYLLFTSRHFSGFREFSFISQKKGTIWCWLSTGLTIFHLSVGEEW